jgi:hypothetical protein
MTALYREVAPLAPACGHRYIRTVTSMGRSSIVRFLGFNDIDNHTGGAMRSLAVGRNSS